MSVSILGNSEEVRFYNKFDNFKLWLRHCISKCISLLGGLLFVGDDWGFLKEVVKTYLLTPMSPLNSPTIFAGFTSIVYDK
jgi:hypothetical protein